MKKKTLIIFILLLTFAKPIFSDEMSPVYKFTIFGKEYYNTIGIIFDFPYEEENNKYFLTGCFGYAFNKYYTVGIDTEFYFGRQFKNELYINKIGVSCGATTFIKETMCNIIHTDILYDLNYILDKNTYIPVYIGFIIKCGCGYVIKKDNSYFCPEVSVGIAIGVLF